MKTPFSDAHLPNIVMLRRASMSIYALLLVPYVARYGVSLVSLGALALGGLCVGWVHGILVIPCEKSPTARRAWENFHFSWFFCLSGLLVAGAISFPFNSYYNLPPLWWSLVVAPLVWLHVQFLARSGVELGQENSRIRYICTLVLICCVLDCGALSYINGAYDGSAIRVYRARVLDREFSSTKSGNFYSLNVELDDGRISTLRVSSQFFSDTVTGQTLEVRVKAGALGAQWIVELL